MFSPNFYDNYFGELLAETNHLIHGNDRRDALDRRMTRDLGTHYPGRTWVYAELFTALRGAGYTIIKQSHSGRGFSTFASDIFYNINPYSPALIVNHHPEDAQQRPFIGSEDLVSLLIDTTPLALFWNWLLGYDAIPIAPDTQHADVTGLSAKELRWFMHEQLLYQSMMHAIENSSSPRFIITTPYITHFTMWDDNTPIGDAYANNHFIAALVMLELIDIILQRNPNAVIVVQGDHGFHADWVLNELRDGGMNDADLFELAHSTISAVRIPEAYGGLDSPIAPVNIARELVNRFVGQNYEMAVPHVNPLR
jgi:hypothetical protein